MGKHQPRRSVSTPGHLYARLQAQCEREGFPVAAVVQGLIEQHLARTEARASAADYTAPELIRAIGHLTDGSTDWSAIRDATGLPEDECKRLSAIAQACVRSPHYLGGAR